jgi:hypothetical protein
MPDDQKDQKMAQAVVPAVGKFASRATHLNDPMAAPQLVIPGAPRERNPCGGAPKRIR